MDRFAYFRGLVARRRPDRRLPAILALVVAAGVVNMANQWITLRAVLP